MTTPRKCVLYTCNQIKALLRKAEYLYAQAVGDTAWEYRYEGGCQGSAFVRELVRLHRSTMALVVPLEVALAEMVHTKTVARTLFLSDSEIKVHLDLAEFRLERFHHAPEQTTNDMKMVEAEIEGIILALKTASALSMAPNVPPNKTKS